MNTVSKIGLIAILGAYIYTRTRNPSPSASIQDTLPGAQSARNKPSTYDNVSQIYNKQPGASLSYEQWAAGRRIVAGGTLTPATTDVMKKLWNYNEAMKLQYGENWSAEASNAFWGGRNLALGDTAHGLL